MAHTDVERDPESLVIRAMSESEARSIDNISQRAGLVRGEVVLVLRGLFQDGDIQPAEGVAGGWLLT